MGSEKKALYLIENGSVFEKDDSRVEHNGKRFERDGSRFARKDNGFEIKGNRFAFFFEENLIGGLEKSMVRMVKVL